MQRDGGWVKLYRKILDWERYDYPPAKDVFLHLILTANHKKGRWRGHDIERGERITSQEKIGEETGLTRYQVRNAMKKLQSTGEIIVKTTNKYTRIIVVNYDDYQSGKVGDHQQTTNKPPTNQHQTNTNKKNKKKKKEKKSNVDFSKYRENYPNKKGKARARKLFTSKVKSNKTFTELMQGLEGYKMHRKQLSSEGKFVPERQQGDTFLSKETWKDYLDNNIEIDEESVMIKEMEEVVYKGGQFPKEDGVKAFIEKYGKKAYEKYLSIYQNILFEKASNGE